MSNDRNYSIIGKVEIGTDEYRDLIEEKARAEKDMDDYRSKYWAGQEKTKELQEKVKAQEEAISHYREFINSNADTKAEYKMFLKQKGDVEGDVK